MLESGLATKYIDGAEYAFPKFGARLSLKILVRLSKIVGKPLALGAAALKGEVKKEASSSLKSLLDRDIDKEIIAEAVAALTERLDENEALDLVETLTSRDNCLCDGKKVDFNSHYEGRLGLMFKVLWAALEVQYGNFLGELPASLGTSGIRNHPTTPEQPT